MTEPAVGQELAVPTAELPHVAADDSTARSSLVEDTRPPRAAVAEPTAAAARAPSDVRISRVVEDPRHQHLAATEHAAAAALAARVALVYRLLLLGAATALLLVPAGCAPLCGANTVAGCGTLQVRPQPPLAGQPAPPKTPCGPKPPPPPVAGPLPGTGQPQMDLIRRPSPGVTVSPREVIAPVGSEVVLTAGVCGPDGYLLAGETVQWLGAQGGVGEIVAVGENTCIFDAASEKLDNQFAIGKTSRKYLRLNRGTPSPDDDVTVLRGQAWSSITSPVEGTSHVTAFAPDVKSWDQRKDTAQIHWVDAEWQLPPPSVNPAGTSHVFTTLVSRHTDHSPLPGYVVRYEITGGPGAGFGPGGETLVEVETNALGQASAELVQRTPMPGTTTIRVDIIRPASVARGYQKRLVLGSGMTSKTWSAAQLLVRKTGPAQATVGAAATYKIEVSNPGNTTVENVVVQDRVPEQMSFVSALPNPTVTNRDVTWNLGPLGAGQTRAFELNFRVDRPGTINNCAIVTAAGGLTVQDCVSTTVVNTQLEVRMRGPAEGAVGDNITFEITAVNRGDVPATGLVVIDSFDQGLEHASGANPIVKRDLGELGPGQSRTFGVTLRLLQPGEWCQRIEMKDGSGTAVQDRFCIRVKDAPPPPTGKLTVLKTGPRTRRVGESAKFQIVIRNNGDGYLRNVRVLDRYDANYFDATFASEGLKFAANGVDLEGTLTEPLGPGQERILEIVCDCLRATREACNTVTVSADGVAPVESRTCVEITDGGSAPRLSLRMAESDDPVRLNGVVTYYITILNEGQQSVRDVRLTVEIPSQMRFEGLSPANPTRHREQQGAIYFDPIVEVRAGSQLRYEVRLRGLRSGSATVNAFLTEGTASEPFVRASERTEIQSSGN